MPLALITGASRGVGAATARALSPTYELVLLGRDQPKLDLLADEIGGATTISVDLTDHAAVADKVAGVGPIDALVHSAGIASTLDPVATTPAGQWRELLDVNVVAVAELTRLLLPGIRGAGGHIVFLNSGAGMRVNPGWTPYAASKFALRALADGLRAEEPRIRVTSVFPGRIDTEMQRGIVDREGNEYRPENYLRPETVAASIANLLATPGDAHPTEIVLRPR